MTPEQLIAAPSPLAGLALLEEVLGQQMWAALEPHPAVSVALVALGRGAYRQPIARLVGEIGISQKRLGQLFHGQVGLTPKQLARVWRFQAALRLLQVGPMEGWAERALACGMAGRQPGFHTVTPYLIHPDVAGLVSYIERAELTSRCVSATRC